MNNDSRREELLADMLAEDGQLRCITLEVGLAEMRRIRKWRRIMRQSVRVCLLLIVLIALARGYVFRRPKGSKHAPPEVVQAEPLVPGTSIRVIDDEKLLEFFKGRPVALVGPTGHQRLVLFDERIN